MYVRVLQDELKFPDDRAIDQDTKSLIRGVRYILSVCYEILTFILLLLFIFIFMVVDVVSSFNVSLLCGYVSLELRSTHISP